MFLIKGWKMQKKVVNMVNFILCVFFHNFKIFIFTLLLLLLFLPSCPPCRILVSQSGIEPMLPAMEMRNPNHWTTREVPQIFILNALICKLTSFEDYIQLCNHHCIADTEHLHQPLKFLLIPSQSVLILFLLPGHHDLLSISID